jgi:hypothetical protein
MSDNYQGIADDGLPPLPKPSLQQYDNYQIYDLVCVDKLVSEKFKHFLAIQAYSPYQIQCDFVAIANTYRMASGKPLTSVMGMNAAAALAA